jgi:lipopolysaccharide transport system permease protein
MSAAITAGGGRQQVAPVRVARLLLRNRKILVATTRVELEKRYSGSLLGRAWVLLYPTLFLSVYLFLYLVIFKIRLPGFSSLQYVVYIFSGLVPYIAFSDAVNGAAVSLKQNLHLVRNVILPVELIPARVVGAALVTEAVGLTLLVGLTGLAGSLSWHMLALPAAALLQIVFLLGTVLLVAPLGLILPDIAYFINIFVLFLLFVSPIGFKPEAIPSGFEFLVWLNPVYYLLVPFRFAALGSQGVGPLELVLAVVISLGTYALGCTVFVRSKGFLLDHE